MSIIVVILFLILCVFAGYGVGMAFGNSELLIKWPALILVLGGAYIVGHYLDNGGV